MLADLAWPGVLEAPLEALRAVERLAQEVGGALVVQVFRELVVDSEAVAAPLMAFLTWFGGTGYLLTLYADRCETYGIDYNARLTRMAEKKLVRRKAEGRAFLYSARQEREKTLSTLLGDLLSRAFDGSADSLVAHLLEKSSPSPSELERIRQTIAEYEKK